MLKTVNPTALGHLPTIARLEREIEILKQVSRSEYIVQYIASGLTKFNAPFVATRYSALGTVEEWINQRGPVPWIDALSTLESVARALVELHAKGIVHRDITPANLVVSSTSPLHAILADFSAALKPSGLRVTITGDQMGTLHYMAPEILHGMREPSSRSDIYSLGMVAIEMLAGAPQVAADAVVDQLEVPEAAAELLASMTSSLPENRPPTADALLGRILRISKGDVSEVRSARDMDVEMRRHLPPGSTGQVRDGRHALS
jgi:eukaryotic-like serine/threonine-protein kinase